MPFSLLWSENRSEVRIKRKRETQGLVQSSTGCTGRWWGAWGGGACLCRVCTSPRLYIQNVTRTGPSDPHTREACNGRWRERRRWWWKSQDIKWCTESLWLFLAVRYNATWLHIRSEIPHFCPSFTLYSFTFTSENKTFWFYSSGSVCTQQAWILTVLCLNTCPVL